MFYRQETRRSFYAPKVLHGTNLSDVGIGPVIGLEVGITVQGIIRYKGGHADLLALVANGACIIVGVARPLLRRGIGKQLADPRLAQRRSSEPCSSRGGAQ